MKYKATWLGIILMLSLVVFIVPSVKAFVGSNGEYGNWSWDETNKILRIVANATVGAGHSETNAFGFVDITNAIDYYGWSAQYNKSYSGTQFEFSFRIVIGDGSTTTWFVDTEKQVTFTDGIVSTDQHVIQLTAHGHVRLGILHDATTKRTSKGCHIISLDTDNHCLFGPDWDSRYYYFYSSAFSAHESLPAYGGGYSRIMVGEDSKIYNCILNGVAFAVRASGDVFNVVVTKGLYGVRLGHASPIDKLTLYGVYYAISPYGADNLTVKNVFARGNTYLFDCGAITTDKYAINVDADSWNFRWSGNNTAKVIRQYEFDLAVTHPNGTAFEGVSVTIWNNQGQVGTWLTDSNGEIPTQILSMGHYNQNGGNTIYSYNPYRIKIESEEYDTIDYNFTLSDKTAWKIPMKTSEPAHAGASDGSLVTTLFFAAIGVCGLIISGIIVRKKWRKKKT